jgi:hypothetical protein
MLEELEDLNEGHAVWATYMQGRKVIFKHKETERGS